jgi:transcriptional regulator GlxA family with amidase domain
MLPLNHLPTFDKPLSSSRCQRGSPDHSFAHIKHNLVLLPPFLPVPNSVSPDSDVLRGWIVKRYGRGSPVAAMCTGVFLLAETGLLNGKIATTNWQLAEKFNRRFPDVILQVAELLTEEDGLICTGAATSNFNLGLKLIERYGTNELSSLCSKALLVDPNRDSQLPYLVSADIANQGGKAKVGNNGGNNR